MVKKETELKSPAPQVKYQCQTCGNVFFGAKRDAVCPVDGEQERLVPLNEKDMPLQIAQEALGSTAGPKLDKTMRFRLGDLDVEETPEEMQKNLFKGQLTTAIRAQSLESAKKQAAEAKAERLEAEKKLKAREGGEEVETAQSKEYAASSMFGPSMVMSVIMNMPEEQRESLLERIERNPQLAMTLGMLLNPPQFGGNLPMMNPYMFSQFATPQQQQSTAPVEKGESIKDIMEAFKVMMETQLLMKGGEDQTEKVIETLRQGNEELRQQYNNLRLEIVQKFADRENEGGTKKVQLTPDVLRQMIDQTIEQKGLRKTPADLLNEVTSFVEAAETFKEKVGGKKGDVTESFDDWLKKETIKKEIEEKKMAHEEEMAKLDRDKSRFASARQFLQSGMLESIRRGATKKAEKEPPKKPPVVFDDTILSLVGPTPSDAIFGGGAEGESAGKSSEARKEGFKMILEKAKEEAGES